MFNPTKELELKKKWQKKYAYSRFLVFVIFILIALWVTHSILFSSPSFSFSFRNPSASKNSNINPRIPYGAPYENGNIGAGESLTFDTVLVGDFSRATVNFDLEGDSPNPLDGKLEIFKSYQAFFYPTAEPLGFKDGSLLKNGGNRFIVSSGFIRKFSSADIIQDLGFKNEAFIEVLSSDLSINPHGEDITSLEYPSDSIFHVLDEYYQLKEDTLHRFVSEKAYLTQYSPLQAIEKDSSFLNNYPISEDYIGFADGTLLSADISVYIVSGGEIYPVNNPVTFESMGYLWSNIVSANSEEIGMYAQHKLFTISSPHPDGTIFHSTDNDKYYYIHNGMKSEIISRAALSTYPKNNYIPLEEKSLDVKTSCVIESQSIFFGLHKCRADISAIKDFPGNNYQFRTILSNPIKLQTLNVNFDQALTLENVKKAIIVFRNRIFNNYKIPLN